jgi:hypothetical protein
MIMLNGEETNEVEYFFKKIGHCPSLKNYHHKDVMQLVKDYSYGLFSNKPYNV